MEESATASKPAPPDVVNDDAPSSSGPSRFSGFSALDLVDSWKAEEQEEDFGGLMVRHILGVWRTYLHCYLLFDSRPQ